MSANGSNPRLDRIERLIEESERANKEAHARHEHQRHQEEVHGDAEPDDLQRIVGCGQELHEPVHDREQRAGGAHEQHAEQGPR